MNRPTSISERTNLFYSSKNQKVNDILNKMEQKKKEQLTFNPVLNKKS